MKHSTCPGVPGCSPLCCECSSPISLSLTLCFRLTAFLLPLGQAHGADSPDELCTLAIFRWGVFSLPIPATLRRLELLSWTDWEPQAVNAVIFYRRTSTNGSLRVWDAGVCVGKVRELKSFSFLNSCTRRVCSFVGNLGTSRVISASSLPALKNPWEFNASLSVVQARKLFFRLAQTGIWVRLYSAQCGCVFGIRLTVRRTASSC